MKRWLSTLLALLTLCAAFPASPALNAAAASDEIRFTVKVTATDTTVGNSVVLYPNETDKPRVISTSTYNFRNAKVLIFDASGQLIEAGGSLMANENGIYGCAQTSVTIPAGGFMIGFDSNADLLKCYETAFEGAVLYNATMSIIYDVRASYDKATQTLSVAYPAEMPETENTVRFLFVGNSTTYFNGTPIKFKGLCRAAGLDVSVTYCTFGSAYLSEFADPNHERGKAYRKLVSEQKFDYVVFQDMSTVSQEDMEAYLKVLLPLAEANGAKGMLYMRYASNPGGTAPIYRVYTSLGETLGMKVAPSAVAYCYCMLERPELNLFADDNAHHSAIGSYLIACTWLRSFMGANPVGNSYTASFDAETVAYLQEVALRACDEPFDPDAVLAGYFTDADGKTYPNLALKKPYTPNGGVYKNQAWTDTGADGKPKGKLTDGVSAPNGNGSDAACGCYTGKDTNITIDLGGTFEMKRFATDLYGNAGWDIDDPTKATVSVSVSEDGKSFTELGKLNAEETLTYGSWSCVQYGLTLEQTVKAAYVRIRYQLNTGAGACKSACCWVSEINTYGINKPVTPDELLPGDLNGDGGIDATDYLTLKKHILETLSYELNDAQLKAADYNGDGEIDAVDYIALKKAFLADS